MGASLLERPDSGPETIEAAFGFRLPLFLQVTRFAQRQVHALIEIVAGLAIAAKHLVGDVGTQEVARFVEERLIVVGEFDP